MTNLLRPRQLLVHSHAGFSLIEMLVGISIGTLVVSVSFEALAQWQQRFAQQQSRMSRHQELRIGLDVFANDLRLSGNGSVAGGPALLSMAEREIRFSANLAGLVTTLTQPVSSLNHQLSVVDGADWPKGKRVMVCAMDRCAAGQLAKDGQQKSLLLSQPLGQAFAAGAAVFVLNEVRYYVGNDQKGVMRLMRDVDGGAATLVGNLAHFDLAYLGKDGRPVVQPNSVTRVRIGIGSLGEARTITQEVGLRT